MKVKMQFNTQIFDPERDNVIKKIRFFTSQTFLLGILAEVNGVRTSIVINFLISSKYQGDFFLEDV